MLWHGKNFRGIINKAKEMIFDNTGTDLSSTNTEDAIKEVNSNLAELENNDLGTVIDISNYTSTNMFTCTSDGYVVVSANSSGAVSSVAIVGSSGDPNNRILLEASYATGRIIVPTLVRKGMMLYKNSGSGTYGMSFKPFV